MVNRVSPDAFLNAGVEGDVPVETNGKVVYVGVPVQQGLEMTEDMAYKYIMIIALVIISIAALKYILKEEARREHKSDSCMSESVLLG